MADNWFEEWFDSPLYEKLYTYRDEEEARKMISLLERHLSVGDHPRVLDLGCGRGRHSLNLARRGYRVKGVDLSETAIEKAREKAERENVENAEFEIRDMREPLDETFEAVVNLFTTFGYFESDEENEGILDSVVEMLKPDGLFILDYLNAPRVRSTYVSEERGVLEGFDYHIQRWIGNNAIHKRITFSGGELDEDHTYTEHVKLYDRSWFRHALNGRGLQVEDMYGSYDGDPYEPQESPRLILVSRLSG